MPNKVLIVDDDPLTVRLVERLLQNEGYETVCATDGLDAMLKVRNERPDLIVLDVVMPEVNGYDVCYQLRFNKDYDRIPIVLLTECDKEIHDLISEKVKISYVSKPVNTEIFLGKVRAAAKAVVEDASPEDRVKQLNLGFIGTGLMGEPMAARLLADYQVMVYNRRGEKTAPLVDAGATQGQTAQEVVDHSDVIIMMLTDAAAIREVVAKIDESTLGGKVILQMGTIGAGESRDLSETFRASGASYLECPVLGSKTEAAEGRLILMAAGSKDPYQILRPILSHLGENPRWIGQVGQAAVLKLALNHLIATHAAGFSLSLALCRDSGIDPADLISVLKGSALYAPMFEKKLLNWLEHDYTRPNFPLKHLLKDVKLVREAGENAGCDPQAVLAIEKIIERAMTAGFGSQDYSALYEAVANRNLEKEGGLNG